MKWSTTVRFTYARTSGRRQSSQDYSFELQVTAPELPADSLRLVARLSRDPAPGWNEVFHGLGRFWQKEDPAREIRVGSPGVYESTVAAFRIALDVAKGRYNDLVTIQGEVFRQVAEPVACLAPQSTPGNPLFKILVLDRRVAPASERNAELISLVQAAQLPRANLLGGQPEVLDPSVFVHDIWSFDPGKRTPSRAAISALLETETAFLARVDGLKSAQDVVRCVRYRLGYGDHSAGAPAPGQLPPLPAVDVQMSRPPTPPIHGAIEPAATVDHEESFSL